MRSRLFALWGATALLAGSGIAAPVGAQASGEQVFEFTGEVATFVVPDDVCRITIDAYGASGGAGALGANPVTPGGLGARATGTIDVTPGEPLAIVVGGAGGDAAAPLPGRGGFGGGGDGGRGDDGITDPRPGYTSGGGGGGASSVSRDGEALLVAAGGGGGGGWVDGGAGGHGGEVGEDGQDGSVRSSGGRAGGHGGAGGTSDADDPEHGEDGQDGAPGAGGAGGYGVVDGGGGGGGGAMGGGGGAGMTSNGGGGGGGGSSAGPAGTVFETGVREGDGLITLTWVVGDGCPPVPPDSTAPPADAAEPTPSDPARPPAEGVTAPARGAAPVRALPTYAG